MGIVTLFIFKFFTLTSLVPLYVCATVLVTVGALVKTESFGISQFSNSMTGQLTSDDVKVVVERLVSVVHNHVVNKVR